MAIPLSPSDRSSLAAEQGAVNMAVGGVLVFEPGAGITRELVLERLSKRIHLIERLRQRLQAPAMGLANPVWVDDTDFELDWHVRSATVPAPGGSAELSAFVGREAARKLDRARPLWEVTVIDGLNRGHTAVLARLHHALVDGVGAVALGALLLDPTPEPLEIPGPESEWEPKPYTMRRHLTRVARNPIGQAQKLMLEAATRAIYPDPRKTANELRGATELLTELARARPSAPETPLNERLGANRRYAIADIELATIKAAARAAGGTVNDALLAAVAGMLRITLGAERGWRGRPPVALVPVSVRRPGDDKQMGNKISTVLVDLPVDVADPRERIRVVNEQMTALKNSAAVRAGALMVGASGIAPPLLSAALARAMGGVRAFNLVVSNVPGPQMPLYLNGCRLLAAYPVVPLNPSNQRLNVGILSFDGHVGFGLLGDAALEPSVSEAANALRASLSELAPHPSP